MNLQYFRCFVSAGCAVAALGLAIGAGAAGAQTTPHAGHPAPAGTALAAPSTAPHDAAACTAMMAKKTEMHAKMQAMDVSLDKLVAEMNATKGSKEKAMAAVLTELVAQRKAQHAMRQEMEPAMMAHMSGQMDGHGKHGAMCPMMKQAAGTAPK